MVTLRACEAMGTGQGVLGKAPMMTALELAPLEPCTHYTAAAARWRAFQPTRAAWGDSVRA